MIIVLVARMNIETMRDPIAIQSSSRDLLRTEHNGTLRLVDESSIYCHYCEMQAMDLDLELTLVPAP